MPLSPQTKGSRFSGGQRAPCDSHSASRRLRGGWRQPLLTGDAVWHGHRLRSRPGPSPEAGSGHGAQGPGRSEQWGPPGQGQTRQLPAMGPFGPGQGARGARGEGPAQGAGTGRAQGPPPAPLPPRTHLSAGTAVGRVPARLEASSEAPRPWPTPRSEGRGSLGPARPSPPGAPSTSLLPRGSLCVCPPPPPLPEPGCLRAWRLVTAGCRQGPRGRRAERSAEGRERP